MNLQVGSRHLCSVNWATEAELPGRYRFSHPKKFGDIQDYIIAIIVIIIIIVIVIVIILMIVIVIVIIIIVYIYMWTRMKKG